MEAILKSAKWDNFPKDFKMGFKLFRTPVIGWLMIVGMNIFVEQILPKAIVRKLSEAEKNHYRAPYKHLKNLKTVDIGPGIHYLQEDNPHLIGSELAQWYKGLG